MEVNAGNILLSDPFMMDPNFKRAVVMLCDHQEEGSIGFILNKSLNLKIGDAMSELGDFPAELHYGGPVETDTLHYLHKLGDGLEGSIRVVGDLYWGGNFEILSLLIKNQQISPSDIRFFLGYTGWGSGQLKEEMKEKSWIVSAGKASYVFKRKITDLWQSIMQSMGGKYQLMAGYPEDPRWN